MFRWPDRTISAIFLIALVLRLSLVLAVDAVIDPGEVQYNALAAQGGVDARYAPLYPLFLRLVYGLSGRFDYRAVCVIQSAASSLVVVLMYAATSRVGGRRAGLIAALITALYPAFIFYNRGIVIESWSVLLVASMMAVAAGAMREVPRACSLGILTGLGVLLKPAFIFFIPGFLATARRRLAYLAVLLAVLAPLIVHNSVVNRAFVPVYQTSSYAFTFDLYAGYGWRMVDLVYANVLRLYSWQPLQGAVSQGASGEGITAVNYLRTYGCLVLLWLGLIGLARCWRREHLSVVAPILAAVILLLFFTRSEPRFRAFLEPLFIMYVSLLFGRACNPADQSEHALAPEGK